MECFLGKLNNSVPVFKLSHMIFMHIRKLHEQCTKHWQGTVNIAVTSTSPLLLPLSNREEGLVFFSGVRATFAGHFSLSGTLSSASPVISSSVLRDMLALLRLFRCSLMSVEMGSLLYSFSSVALVFFLWNWTDEGLAFFNLVIFFYYIWIIVLFIIRTDGLTSRDSKTIYLLKLLGVPKVSFYKS